MVDKNLLEKLHEEVDIARRKIKTDMLSMSIGEIISKIDNNELILRPKFQRYFRWDEIQKSNLVESILMNLPIPSIFVSTNSEGKWEVIDGLQRLTTIYKFCKDDFSLQSCVYIKLFKGLYYKDFSEKLKLMFRNKRIDFVILDEASDANAKYDMFNRLNTGGSSLSYQEVRNCSMIMKNEKFFDWFDNLKNDKHFKATVTQEFSERYQDEQKELEMILKFLAIRYTMDGKFEFTSSNSFLDAQALAMCSDVDYDKESNEKAFKETFNLLDYSMVNNAFKKYDPKCKDFYGPVNFPIYEILIAGIGKHILSWDNKTKSKIKSVLKEVLIKMYSSPEFEQISKIGTTVSQRLKKAVNYADEVFTDDGIKI